MKIIYQRGGANPSVEVTSHVRLEHILMLVGFAFLFIMRAFSGDQPWYIILVIPGLFLICHFWIHLVYRMQENSLIEKLQGQLKLMEKPVVT